MKTFSGGKVARCDQQRPSHPPGGGPVGQICCEQTSQTMSNQIGFASLLQSAFKLCHPVRERRLIPVVLCYERRIRLIIQPVVLPMSDVRTEQSRQNEDTGHVRSLTIGDDAASWPGPPQQPSSISPEEPIII